MSMILVFNNKTIGNIINLITFINLKKACDLVLKEAMWLALNRLGVPLSLVELFRLFQGRI